MDAKQPVSFVEVSCFFSINPIGSLGSLPLFGARPPQAFMPHQQHIPYSIRLGAEAGKKEGLNKYSTLNTPFTVQD